MTQIKIEFENISLAYGNRLILDNINFKINEGQIFGMLGPNGVGKSTIFNLITGLISPKSGKIKINGEDLTAKVQSVSPFFEMGYRVSFSLGTYPLKEYIYHLNNFYKEENKYEIEIVDGIDFKAAKYFDITANNWKLDKLVPSVLEASKLCKTINHLDS